VYNQDYLLLVEDDDMMQKKNKVLLERKGYPLRQAFSLTEAKAVISEFGMPRAIILDVMLPDGNGMDFLKELRQTSNVPVLMLTSLNTQEDILEGLKAGGDYYLVKPCNQMIFTSHVEALLRRGSAVPEMLVYGPIKLNPASGRAFLNEEDMALTQKEFALLQQFIQYPNKLLYAKNLYEKVWDQEMSADAYSLKTTISRLRTKMAGSGYTITAAYGEGYILESE